MTEQLHLEPRHREQLEALLREHLPDVDAWAYGSRVNGQSHDGSDLDLVLRGPDLQEIEIGQLADFTEALQRSTIPFLVEARDWTCLPESFHREIEKKYVPISASLTGGPASMTVALTVVPSGWCEVTLGDYVQINDFTYSPREAWPFINYLDTSNITENRISEIHHLVTKKDKIPSRARRKVKPGDIVYSTVRPDRRHFGLLREVPENFLASTGFSVIRGKSGAACTDFIYWFLAQDRVVEQLHTIAEHSTSAYPSIKPSDIEQLKLRLPPLPEQRAIAHVLGTLDDKIELNRRMNETLEEMAQALFKSWFVDFDPVHAKAALRDHPSSKGSDWTVERARAYLDRMDPDIAALFPDRFMNSELGQIPEGWEVKALDEIASFRNGLALQKHRPQGNEEWLPVVKIAQLRSGNADNGEKATANIQPECIIDDGDVIFSWSGSLMVKIWYGGRAALNQHLFKVTSTKFPKWFFLHCVRSHLADFQIIAAGKATTMGHIKRHHLSEAMCAVPNDQLLSATNGLMATLLEKSIAENVQSCALSVLRDTILPKLVSGELRIKNMTEA